VQLSSHQPIIKSKLQDLARGQPQETERGKFTNDQDQIQENTREDISIGTEETTDVTEMTVTARDITETQEIKNVVTTDAKVEKEIVVRAHLQKRVYKTNQRRDDK